MTDDPKIAQYARAVSLLAEGNSAGATAKILGINRKTLFNWRNDPVFRHMHKEVCDGAVHFARAELAQMTTDAVAALRDSLSPTQSTEELERNKLRRQSALNVLQVVGAFKYDDPIEDLDDEKLDALIARLGYQPVDTVIQ